MWKYSGPLNLAVSKLFFVSKLQFLPSMCATYLITFSFFLSFFLLIASRVLLLDCLFELCHIPYSKSWAIISIVKRSRRQTPTQIDFRCGRGIYWKLEYPNSWYFTTRSSIIHVKSVSCTGNEEGVARKKRCAYL